MTLSHVTHAGVLDAAAEFDRLGRDAFLKSTGFGPARAYFLQHNGNLYDSKAIIGYAHGVSIGVPLRSGRLQRWRQDGGPAARGAWVQSAEHGPPGLDP